MKMITEIRIGDKEIARVEIEGVRRNWKSNKTIYSVVVFKDKTKFEMEIEHVRMDGPFRLMEIICRKVRKMVDEYYSYPKDKVENGLIRGSDIPKRYRKEFSQFFGVGTVALMPKTPCPVGCLDLDFKKKDEVAYNISDLLVFLDNRKYGRKKVWD